MAEINLVSEFNWQIILMENIFLGRNLNLQKKNKGQKILKALTDRKINLLKIFKAEY